MKRRTFTQLATTATMTGMFGSMMSGTAKGFRPTDLDKYGGWKGKPFKATGFFRVEKDQRWWIVTPEGNAFLSFGINHLYPDLFKGKHNVMWPCPLPANILILSCTRCMEGMKSRKWG